MAQQLGNFEKLLRVGEGRRLKRLGDQAAYIGTLEPEFERLSDAELAAKTGEFKQTAKHHRGRQQRIDSPGIETGYGQPRLHRGSC